MKNLQQCVYFFVQKPWRLCNCFWKKNVQLLLNIFFYVKDPRKFQADSVMIMFDAAPTWVPKQSFLIIFSRCFDARDPMNYIVHQRCYEKSSHKVCIFFCRNREDCVLKRKCAAASLYFVQKPCSWYFFILKQMCDCF